MKLSQLRLVNQAQDERRKLDDAIRATEANLIDVMLAGKYQDDAMKAVLKAPLLAELKARKASLDRDLAGLGVQVD